MLVPTDSDRVDRLVSDITRLRPDLDGPTKAVGARLLRLSDVVLRYYTSVCEEFGISLAGHSVLTALARQAPKKLTLTEINRDVLVTSGGITFVAKQLENQGLVERSPHPGDGRASLLRLTARGRRVADRVIDAIAEADRMIVSQLSREDQRLADHLLRQLQTSVEAALEANSRTMLCRSAVDPVTMPS